MLAASLQVTPLSSHACALKNAEKISKVPDPQAKSEEKQKIVWPKCRSLFEVGSNPHRSRIYCVPDIIVSGGCGKLVSFPGTVRKKGLRRNNDHTNYFPRHGRRPRSRPNRRQCRAPRGRGTNGKVPNGDPPLARNFLRDAEHGGPRHDQVLLHLPCTAPLPPVLLGGRRRRRRRRRPRWIADRSIHVPRCDTGGDRQGQASRRHALERRRREENEGAQAGVSLAGGNGHGPRRANHRLAECADLVAVAHHSRPRRRCAHLPQGQ